MEKVDEKVRKLLGPPAPARKGSGLDEKVAKLLSKPKLIEIEESVSDEPPIEEDIDNSIFAVKKDLSDDEFLKNLRQAVKSAGKPEEQEPLHVAHIGGGKLEEKFRKAMDSGGRYDDHRDAFVPPPPAGKGDADFLQNIRAGIKKKAEEEEEEAEKDDLAKEISRSLIKVLAYDFGSAPGDGLVIRGTFDLTKTQKIHGLSMPDTWFIGKFVEHLGASTLEEYFKKRMCTLDTLKTLVFCDLYANQSLVTGLDVTDSLLNKGRSLEDIAAYVAIRNIKPVESEQIADTTATGEITGDAFSDSISNIVKKLFGSSKTRAQLKFVKAPCDIKKVIAIDILNNIALQNGKRLDPNIFLTKPIDDTLTELYKTITDLYYPVESFNNVSANDVKKWRRSSELYERLERFEEAAKCFERIAKIEPKNFEAQSRHIDLLIKCGRLEDVQSNIDILLQQESNSAAFYKKKTEYLQLLKSQGKASFGAGLKIWYYNKKYVNLTAAQQEQIKSLEDVVHLESIPISSRQIVGGALNKAKLHIWDFEAIKELSDCLRNCDLNKAYNVYSLFADSFASLAEFYCEKGAVAFELGRKKEAMKCFEKALKINPDLKNASKYKAKLLFNDKKFEKSLDICEKILSREADVEILRFKAEILYKLGYFKDVCDILGRLEITFKDDLTYWIRYKDALAHIKDVTNELTCLEKIISLNPKDADAHFEIGDIYLRSKDNNNALNYFSKTLELDPRHLGAARCKCVALHRQGRHKELVEACDYYLKLRPDDPKVREILNFALKELGKSAQDGGKSKDAEIFFEEAYLSSQDEDAAWKLLRSYMENREYSKAINIANRILQTGDEPCALRDKGIALYNLHDSKRALACFEEALRINPKLTECLKGKARILSDNGNFPGAFECYRAVLSINYDDAETWAAAGKILVRLQEYSNAIKYFDRVLKSGKEDDDLLIHLSMAHFKTKEYVMAQNYLGRIIQNNAQDTSALHLLAKVHDAQQHPLETLKILQTLRAMGESNLEEKIRECEIYAETGDGERAFNSSQELLKDPALQKEHAEKAKNIMIRVLLNKGDAQFDNKQYDNAISYYDQAIQIDQTNTRALNNRAFAASKLGKYTDAIKYYQYAMKLEPNNDTLWCNAANMYIKTNQFENAIECYQHILKTNPKNKRANLGLANVLASINRTSDAENQYKKTIELFPEDVDARIKYADLLKQTGRETEAVEHYETVVRMKDAK